ncbi:MAG: bifunctional sugar-binding transcriptional regulator/dihydroxyacetone kinase subunit DhaK [Roseiarcus sp.]|uniref:bifunctional sugar-binding transcriptional regulator/dihydroxyacetone kinase subunit DhaK n=1 Tax=Roseiarcus sp. TaxID=1969460 RepID=UPI003C262F36
MTNSESGLRGSGRPRLAPVEAGGATPLRFGDDPYVWASWLYYQEGMTQSDIAQTMGISRATVIAYLNEARERGIVNISIEPGRLASLTLAQSLKSHFNLRDCFVIPNGADDQALGDRLGVAGALALRKVLKSGDTLAVTGGRTVMAVADGLKVAGLQDVTVVQAIGGAIARNPASPGQCASTIASAVNATCVSLSAPAVVSSVEARRLMVAEPLVAEQLEILSRANKALFGIASLRPNASLYSDGVFDAAALQSYIDGDAVGVLAARFIDAWGQPVAGTLDDRVIGLSLEDLLRVDLRICVAGGFDKVPAILAALRRGYANVLVTDAATARGVLRADGGAELERRPGDRQLVKERGREPRRYVKKFINEPDVVVEEMLDGAIRAHRAFLRPLASSRRALVALDGPRPGKVGLVVGGGSGHEPCFLGYVGKGLADAAAVGNIFSTPPPDPIFHCAQAVSGGAGVLLVYGNYVGDVMNFDMAAEIARDHGIETRSIVTTDDVASSPRENRGSRRGVAGNVFVFKIAGAACDKGWSLDVCEAVTRKANARTYTVGVALEPCSLPQTRRYNFDIGPDEIEVGMGIHGEPGVMRGALASADETVDMILDQIFSEMRPVSGDKVAVLVNSLGGTPLMELYILYRRVEQRLAAKGVEIDMSFVGHYCTSIDMVGASISLLHLDRELRELLHHPCRTAFLQVS